MSYREIGKLADFPDGKAVGIRVGARQIAVYRFGNDFHAVKDICPHEAHTLHRAPPDGRAAVCQSHGWRFDLRTGQCLRGRKDARIAVYPVKVEGDKVFIDV